MWMFPEINKSVVLFYFVLRIDEEYVANISTYRIYKDVYCMSYGYSVQHCNNSFPYLIPCCSLSLFLTNFSKVEVNFLCTTVNNLNCSVPWTPACAFPQSYEVS